ncbi:MAG: hypothetical protein FGM15_01435 [Chthoniobacterales bacterium]|nr:hypothetical protein [Chthoniobacterales bacterium]
MLDEPACQLPRRLVAFPYRADLQNFASLLEPERSHTKLGADPPRPGLAAEMDRIARALHRPGADVRPPPAHQIFRRVRKRLLMTLNAMRYTALIILALAAATHAAPVNLRPWEPIIVQDSGRKKPMGTFGHEALVKISGRDPVTTKAGEKVGGDEFAISIFYATRDWADEPLILISYHPLAKKLGLDPSRKRFSRREIAGAAKELETLSREAVAMRRANPEEPPPMVNTEAQTVLQRLAVFDALADTSAFKFAPPPPGSAPGTPWMGLAEMAAAYPAEKSMPVLQNLRELNSAMQNGDDARFSDVASHLQSDLRALNPELYPSTRAIDRELLYNRLKPFDSAMWLFAAGGLLLAAGARHGWRRWPLRGGVVASVLGLAFMLVGITLRVLVAGRAPVTNMYESVIWVAMGTVLFGLLFYAAYRNRLMLLSALPVSFLGLLLARSLPVAMPSRLDPLVPVLRDNFWLTVHVLTITLSYAAFALALGFAHVVLWRYIRQPRTAPAMHNLHTWLYRMMFVGLILLAAGTILGGVWANYSWGRFWGWDPKETWALIALLMYVVAIHGKMAGWWGDFGMAVAAVVNFSGVLMAWYGVNFVLGTGKHSYGFGVGGEGYVILFIAVEAAYLALAIVRHRRARNPATAPA